MGCLQPRHFLLFCFYLQRATLSPVIGGILGVCITRGSCFSAAAKIGLPRLSRPPFQALGVSAALPRRIRERVLGGLLLRFLESLLGSKVFFFFVRSMWACLGPSVLVQESLFARRIIQYGGAGLRHKKSQ
jgi:hypothetical protein